jgi:hypothetical protein
MKRLRFEGSSDDTFGENTTGEDYDNCASMKPIIFKVWSPSTNDGLYVVGQYCPGPLTGWMVGVGRLNEDDDKRIPEWPISITPGETSPGRFATPPYTSQLTIDAPDDVEVSHVKEEDD